jgi:type I restriction enzyme R subunit
MLYQSPFTDITPREPEGLFSSSQIEELVIVLQRVRQTASAA